MTELGEKLFIRSENLMTLFTTFMPNTKHTKSPLILQPIAPRLVTIKQAAAYCSCAVWAIRQAIWSRELPACKISGRYLIDRAHLDAFIDDRIREHAS